MSTTRGTTGRRDGDVARHETANLIASDKVEGTAVYDPHGNEIGAIQSLMIDKIDGRVAYVVLSLDARLVNDANYYPVPWEALKYDPHVGGYVTGLTREHVQDAPSYDAGTDWRSRVAGWPAEVDRYYSRPEMWAH